MTTELLPCPHCGNKPELSTEGTFVEVNCCSFMSLQKSDVLTIEQRETWNSETYTFSNEAEETALTAMAKMWNQRA